MDVIPALNELSRRRCEAAVRRWIAIRSYLAVVLGFVQAYFHGMGLFQHSMQSLIEDGAAVSKILYIATIFTAGSMFLLWLGDRISLKGIGNGVSIIIFAGIVGPDCLNRSATTWSTLVGAEGSAAFERYLGVFPFISCAIC